MPRPTREDGYELWLRYRCVADDARLEQYRQALQSCFVLGASATTGLIRDELSCALPALLDRPMRLATVRPSTPGLLVVPLHRLAEMGIDLPAAATAELGAEGYLIRSVIADETARICITGNTDHALLTGTFHFLRLLQTHQSLDAIAITSRPRIQLRVLAHWDNLDGSIERGYAGQSLWKWDELPEVLDPRYHDYARACASVGINGSCLNNVNADALILTDEYLAKAAALANLFRPYGIRVLLAPHFSAPKKLGGLATSDPRDPAVAQWWQEKVAEIYRLIPDFGGFQVKANSEGEPGPQDDGANHDDGANMLADALAPYGGTVLWRAFVYDVTVDRDRAKCAYKEFVPLDGHFRPNVFVQAKNGPVDFMPREPFHPLFGAMPQTPLALEFQITQEYLGQSTHLVYLGGMWQEILAAETYARGPGSTVASIVDGTLAATLEGHARSCIIGVANTGSDRNWCGHHFAQANWFAFGRLAWDHTLNAQAIAADWVRMTWSTDPTVSEPLLAMMLGSWEACINAMMPLGLHHLMQEGHHYGPDPGFAGAWREDWNNVYYHRADAAGLGFDRSSRGSGATSQYHRPRADQLDDPATCPETLLLWFHHVPWAQRLTSGRTLWEELQHRYAQGAVAAKEMVDTWRSLQEQIDHQRHEHVSRRLIDQWGNARLWRDECIGYFRQFAEADNRMNILEE